MSKHWRRDSHARPEPPLGGIPVQRTPGWIRWPLRVLVFPFMWLDLTVQRILQRILRPPYRVEGHCKQRGNCCHYILLGWDPLMDRWPWLGKFWLWWYTEILGFYLRGFDIENEAGDVARVMSCRYLQPNGSCGQYRLRPGICRQWPRIDYVSRPYVLKGCGYRPVPRHSLPSEPIETTEELSAKVKDVLASHTTPSTTEMDVDKQP